MRTAEELLLLGAIAVATTASNMSGGLPFLMVGLCGLGFCYALFQLMYLAAMAAWLMACVLVNAVSLFASTCAQLFNIAFDVVSDTILIVDSVFQAMANALAAVFTPKGQKTIPSAPPMATYYEDEAGLVYATTAVFPSAPPQEQTQLFFGNLKATPVSGGYDPRLFAYASAVEPSAPEDPGNRYVNRYY